MKCDYCLQEFYGNEAKDELELHQVRCDFLVECTRRIAEALEKLNYKLEFIIERKL